ncbi:MAG TPA: DUF2007 domain-containing protein [Chloroflexota bacterium]|nr:DUF2007 domain-containing protein [Chloroflexota bacterium]
MDRLVALGRYGSEAEAALWAELLEREGVPAVLVPLGPGAGGWGVSAGLPHELRVRAADLERARALVDELSATDEEETVEG